MGYNVLTTSIEANIVVIIKFYLKYSKNLWGFDGVVTLIGEEHIAQMNLFLMV